MAGFILIRDRCKSTSQKIINFKKIKFWIYLLIIICPILVCYISIRYYFKARKIKETQNRQLWEVDDTNPNYNGKINKTNTIENRAAIDKCLRIIRNIMEGFILFYDR